MQRLRQVLRSLWRTRRLVGTDLEGNKYYETIREGEKPRREMITDLKHVQYTTETIPIEWEAWLRGKRNDPPSHEELLAQRSRVAIIRERARQVEEKDRESQALEYNQGLVAQPPQIASHLGHASAPLYERLDNRSEPTSTGTTFQPGQWTPGTSSSKDNEDAYEPESWVPPSSRSNK